MTSSHGEQPRSSAPPAPSAGVDAICDAFEAAWFAGHQPRIEDFLSGGDPDHRDGLLRDLLLAEWDLLRRHEQHIELQAYRERFVQNSELVAELWHAWQCAGEETLPPGRSIFFANGRYHLQSRLGEGAQKRVFLARDKELDRDVVIGVLNRGQIESDSLNRLRREAKAMARLEEHPNVVSVYDIAEEDGNPFIVTQYVRGGSVADMLSACKPAPLQIPEAIRIAAQTCRALNHAHAHGILHRDVKPTNVWLMRDGTVKLGDFGLALSLDRTELTDEDMRVGTAAYIAPEQALGAAVGPQSDLYSLGVMLYEMVAGRRPFYGDTALAVISQHVNSRPVAPSWHNPAIDDALDRLILELLAMLMVTRNPSPLLWPEATQAILRSKVPSNSQAMRGNSWPGIDSRPCLDVDWWRDGRLRSGRIGIEEDPRSISELSMPQFLIERNFAEQLEVTKEVASTIKQVNDELSLRWVFSFLSADKKKTYCLYEAPSAEAIREAARRLNIPADRIIELGGQLRPEMFQ